MLRRSFLKGAAALAAAPLVPMPDSVAAPAAASVEVVAPLARYRSCTVWSASGLRVFDGNGLLRVVMGRLDAGDPAWDSEAPHLVQYNA